MLTNQQLTEKTFLGNIFALNHITTNVCKQKFIRKFSEMVIKRPEAVETNLEFLENDFEILEKLGDGGMGKVYKAQQKSMERLVAIKVLQPELCNNLVYVERFKREARLAGKFCHPNAIQVYDIGYNQKQFYFIMEYVNGLSLKEKLSIEGRFDQTFTITVLKQVLSVLKEAEKMNIIHRDIKPDNIMFTSEGVVKLADLGLAREVDDDSGLTQQKVAMGTPHYMAPEQAQGKAIDMRADQYSLGITAFHMLTGRVPFVGKSTMEVLVHHVKTPMIKPSSIGQGISAEMDKLILRMTEKNPEKRYQSIGEIVSALDNINELSKTKRVTIRKKATKTNLEQNARLEKRREKNSFGGIFLLIGLIMLIAGVASIFAFNNKTNSEILSAQKSLDLANQLIGESRFEESLIGLKAAIQQIPEKDRSELVNKAKEVEKIISSLAVEKVMVVALGSIENCTNGITELNSIMVKFPNNSDLAKAKKVILESRIKQIEAEEKKLLELSKEKAKDEAINQLSLEVNNLLFANQFKQATEAINRFNEKNLGESEKLKILTENIKNIESEYSKNVYEKINAYTKNKEFDQCTAFLSSIKDNCNQKDLVAKIEEQIKSNHQLKKENEKEIAKNYRLEFAQAKESIFGLLKIAEIKAAKVKLNTFKSSGLSEGAIDFFSKVIDDYGKIYGRIEIGLANEFKDQLHVNRIGNRNIDAYISSVKNGIIQYTFMDSKLELTPINEDWAQTYTAIATKITKLTKGCRIIRISHFAYANGDLEGAYFLMKEAETLGLEKNEQNKYAKNISEDFFNWLDIQFDRVIEKANTLVLENNKQLASQILKEFIKKYGDTIIVIERKEEIDHALMKAEKK